MILLSPRNLFTVLRLLLLTSIRAQGKGFATIDPMNQKFMVHISRIGFEALLLPFHPLSLIRLSDSNNIPKAFLGRTIPSMY